MASGDIWKNYVRYIGAGAVATAGIITVLRGLPTMVGAFIAVVRGMRNTTSAAVNSVLRTDRDLPGGFVFGAIAVVILVPALVPGILGGNVEILPRIVCSAGIALFGILFVTTPRSAGDAHEDHHRRRAFRQPAVAAGV